MIGPTRRGVPNSAGETDRVGGSHGSDPRKSLIFDPVSDHASIKHRVGQRRREGGTRSGPTLTLTPTRWSPVLLGNVTAV